MTHTERFIGRVGESAASAQSTGPVLNRTRRVAERLQTQLSVLATIDQAIGILISRGGGSAEEATAALRDVSRSHDTDLATVARQIVEAMPARQSRTRNLQR